MKKIGLVLSLILVLVIVGCGKQTSETQQVQEVATPSETQQTAISGELPTTSNEITTVAEPQVKEFTVHGSSFKFGPAELRVKKGDRVRINFISDDIGHNFVIDELDIRTNLISEGASEVVEFVADKVGEFPIYCSVGQHRALGMEGKIIVEP